MTILLRGEDFKADGTFRNKEPYNTMLKGSIHKGARIILNSHALNTMPKPTITVGYFNIPLYVIES